MLGVLLVAVEGKSVSLNIHRTEAICNDLAVRADQSCLEESIRGNKTFSLSWRRGRHAD